MGKYCLVANLAQEFKQKLKDGTIDPFKMAQMTSKQRREFLAGIVGEHNAKNVNALFEKRLLQKNKVDAMIKWAKEVSGIKPEYRRDMLAKIERLSKEGGVLDAASEDAFLEDLASSKLGIDVTFDESQKILEISKDIEVKKAKMEKSPDNYDTRIEYGKAVLDMYDYVESLKPNMGVIDQVANVANAPRALMSSIDLSAPGRQGWGMVGRAAFWKNLKPMVKALVSEEAFKEIEADIISRPNYNMMRSSGLRVTALGKKLTEKEEAFMTTLIDKIPGIKGSQRAYTAFLSKLRADAFDDFVRKAQLAGEDVKAGSKAAKDLARVVNNFTGAGSIGKLDQGAPIMNAIFFSPRKIAATVQMFNPVNYVNPKISMTARKEAFKNLLGMLGATSTLLYLGRLAGGEVELNPLSSDFGKLKVHDMRIDVTGGNSNYATLVARMITNKTKSTTNDIVKELGEGYGAPTRFDTLTTYFRNKLSPSAALIANLWDGKNTIGEKFQLTNELKKMSLPLIIQSAIETAAADKSLFIASVMAEVFGFSTMIYDQKVDWNNSDSIKLKQFKSKVGEDTFKKANDEYNKAVQEKLDTLSGSADYRDLTDDEKRDVISKVKTNKQEEIFRKYNFIYKAETKENKKTINNLAK